MTTPRFQSLSTPEFHETFSGSTPTELMPTEQPGMPPLRTRRPTPEELIATESKLEALWNAGEIPSLLHLEGSVDGSYERWLCDFFEQNVKPTDWVCASHRCHYAYQLHGGTDLVEQVLAGRSMFLSAPRFLCSAIVAGTASIACGLALSIQHRGGSEKVFCFLGDAASEHGHALEAIGFAQAKGLPVKFVITDNDSSCGVSKIARRGSDWEWAWPSCVEVFKYQPKFAHAGNSKRPNLKWLK